MLEKFKALSVEVKLSLIGITLMVIGLLWWGTSTMFSHYHDKRIDAKIQKQEKIIGDLLVEAEKLKAANAGLELQIASIEGQKAASKVAVEQATADIKAKVEDLSDEDKKFQDERSVADQPVDVCERVIRSCERAKSLGLYPPGKVCECNRPTSDN